MVSKKEKALADVALDDALSPFEREPGIVVRKLKVGRVGKVDTDVRLPKVEVDQQKRKPAAVHVDVVANLQPLP